MKSSKCTHFKKITVFWNFYYYYPTIKSANLGERFLGNEKKQQQQQQQKKQPQKPTVIQFQAQM